MVLKWPPIKYLLFRNMKAWYKCSSETHQELVGFNTVTQWFVGKWSSTKRKSEKKIVVVPRGFSNYKSMANFEAFSWNISSSIAYFEKMFCRLDQKKFDRKKNHSDLFAVMSLRYSFPDRSQICYCAIFPKNF